MEDNRRISDLVSERLSLRGFSCDQAYTLRSAGDFVRSGTYDLIVLDLGLPDGDGREWLRSWRFSESWPPTLILTARTALEDRIDGLNSGADDYLVKPFEVDELVARLHALTRRPATRVQPVLQVGRLRFETSSRTASFGSDPLDLSRREADLLELLMRSAGYPVSRSDIDRGLYRADDAVTPNSVEAVVSRLRRKLAKAGGASILQTVRGLGYRLDPEPR